MDQHPPQKITDGKKTGSRESRRVVFIVRTAPPHCDLGVRWGVI